MPVPITEGMDETQQQTPYDLRSRTNCVRFGSASRKSNAQQQDGNVQRLGQYEGRKREGPKGSASVLQESRAPRLQSQRRRSIAFQSDDAIIDDRDLHDDVGTGTERATWGIPALAVYKRLGPSRHEPYTLKPSGLANCHDVGQFFRMLDDFAASSIPGPPRAQPVETAVVKVIDGVVAKKRLRINRRDEPGYKQLKNNLRQVMHGEVLMTAEAEGFRPQDEEAIRLGCRLILALTVCTLNGLLAFQLAPTLPKHMKTVCLNGLR